MDGNDGISTSRLLYQSVSWKIATGIYLVIQLLLELLSN